MVIFALGPIFKINEFISNILVLLIINSPFKHLLPVNGEGNEVNRVMSVGFESIFVPHVQVAKTLVEKNIICNNAKLK